MTHGLLTALSPAAFSPRHSFRHGPPRVAPARAGVPVPTVVVVSLTRSARTSDMQGLRGERLRGGECGREAPGRGPAVRPAEVGSGAGGTKGVSSEAVSGPGRGTAARGECIPRPARVT